MRAENRRVAAGCGLLTLLAAPRSLFPSPAADGDMDTTGHPHQGPVGLGRLVLVVGSLLPQHPVPVLPAPTLPLVAARFTLGELVEVGGCCWLLCEPGPEAVPKLPVLSPYNIHTRRHGSISGGGHGSACLGFEYTSGARLSARLVASCDKGGKHHPLKLWSCSHSSVLCDRVKGITGSTHAFGTGVWQQAGPVGRAACPGAGSVTRGRSKWPGRGQEIPRSSRSLQP